MVKYKMILSKEQEEILKGSKGGVMAKVMETMIRYGELFGADGLVPITSQYNHLVTSFGLKALGHWAAALSRPQTMQAVCATMA